MNQPEENRAQCEHEWKAEGLTEDKSHVKLVCVKCGAKKKWNSSLSIIKRLLDKV